MIADATTNAAIMDTLNAFSACYANRDVQGVLALHALDPDVVVFVVGHRYVGQQQIRALAENDLAGFGAMTWTFTETSVYTAGSAAWLTSSATVTGHTDGQAVPLGVYHFSWVLEQRGDKWLIVHGHVSIVAGEI